LSRCSWASVPVTVYATPEGASALKNTMHPGGQDHLGAEIFPVFTSGIAHRWGHYRANVKNCQCVLVSTFVVSHEVPPLCGDCGNDLRFPPGQVRSQRARLAGFCGAAAPQHRRGAPVKGGFGVATPTSIGPGGQMSGAKFGPRVDTCFRVAPNQFSHFYRCSIKSSKVGFHATLYLTSPG
jgi:hypothetical protein